MNRIAEITIPKADLRKWSDYLRSGNLVYGDLGWGEYENLACWTAKFDDGCEVDLKVNSNSMEDGDCFSEAVLFDSEGRQLSYTEPSDELDGTWYLYVGDDTYTLLVHWGE